MFRFSKLGLLLMVVLLVGCVPTFITGSGEVVTREESITGFSKVDVSHGFRVDISQGETFSVIIRIDDNLARYLEVVKRGSTLNIGLQPNRSYTFTNATLQAEVTMPDLTGLDMSGGSRVTLINLSIQSLNADLSGGSRLQGDIETGNTTFDTSGGSNVTLSGSGQDLTVDASGGSQVNLDGFSVVDANIEASGGARVTVNPSGTLDADASGGARIIYLGNPTMGDIDSSGGASINRK